MSNHKKILVYCLIILFVQNKFKIYSCTPVQINNNDTNDDDFNGDESSNSVTEHGMNAVTRPSSQIIDLNNLDERTQQILENNNINVTKLREDQKRFQEKQKTQNASHGNNENFNAPEPLTQTQNPHMNTQRRE